MNDMLKRFKEFMAAPMTDERIEDNKRKAIENVNFAIEELAVNVRLALNVDAMSQEEMNEYLEKKSNEVMDEVMGMSIEDFAIHCLMRSMASAIAKELI